MAELAEGAGSASSLGEGALQGLGASVVNGISGMITQSISDSNAWNRQTQAQQFQSTTFNEYYNRAVASLKAAGLPEYTLYTNGNMPTYNVYKSGSVGYTQIPFGASSMYWNRRNF
jgi:hypothetical protein